jgi:oligopeptide transport system substrate-binding protein
MTKQLFRRWVSTSCLGLGLLVVFTGCARSERPVDKATREGILLIGNGAEPPDLDPHVVTGVPEFHIIDALFEGLVEENPVTRSVEPGIAESWTVSPDGRRYVFTLRPSAKWSDGQPITANDVVRTYERVMNPLLGSEYAYLFAVLDGGPAYLAGESTDFRDVGVSALTDHQLEIRLRYPVPYFLSLLTYTCWRPLPLHTIEAFDGLRRRGSGWTREGNLVSSGPFQLTEWRQNRVLVVERNPYYWDATTVSLNAIHFFPVESYDTEERMFRSGQLHLTNDVPLAKIPHYRTLPDSPLRIEPQLGTYYFRFNVTRPPLDDVRVRRALSLTIDRQAIVEKISGGGQTTAGSFAPPGAGEFEPSYIVGYDPEEARKLLGEAGYPGGEGFPGVEFLYNTSEGHRSIAEALQQMWKRELGIDVQLYNQEWKVYLDSLSNLDFGIARSGWVAVYNDANQFLEIMTSGNPNNRTGWSSAEYDALHEASMRETDPSERMQLLQQLDEMLMHESPVAPLYHYTHVYLRDARVENWNPGPLDKRRYKYVRLKAE